MCVHNIVLFHTIPSLFLKDKYFLRKSVKKGYSNCVILSWSDSLYTKTYSIQEDLSNHIYNMAGPVSIYFLTKYMSSDHPEKLTKSTGIYQSQFIMEYKQCTMQHNASTININILNSSIC